MANWKAVNIVIGLLVALALAPWAAPADAASRGSARAITIFCARTGTGLMRYATSPAGCKASNEEVVRLREVVPVDVCVSVRARFIHGRRVLIPTGTMWRVPSSLFCPFLHQQVLMLPDGSKHYVCAAKKGGLLRLVTGPGRCHRRELALVVAAAKSLPKAPTANAQSLSTNEGKALAITLTGTSIPAGKPLTYAIATQPAHGTLSGNPPSITYTPSAGYSGSDQLTFTVTQKQGKRTSAPAPVTIAVNHIDHAPVDVVPGEQTTQENGALTFSVLHANAISTSDADAGGGVEQLKLSVGHGKLKLGATAGLESSSGNETAAVTARGTLVALGAALEGLVYEPTPNYRGADALTVESDDLGNTGLEGPKTATATVAISVTPFVYDKAVADSYSTNENEALKVAAAGVLANDSDTDSPPLPLSAVLVAGPSHGVLTLNANGSFEYVPTHNFSGSDSFTYKDNDTNSDSNTVTVTLAVTQIVYDKAVADSYSTNQNETLHVAAAGVLANDSDTDTPALPLSAVLVAGPSHGVLTLNANGSFEYVPTHNFSGSDSFTYKDNDTNSDSNTVTVSLTVKQVVYDTAVADSYSTNQNETLHVAAAGVLANDSDTDTPALPLSAVLVAGPSHGVLTLNKDGSFEYVPMPNFSGSDSFTYKDNDTNTDSNTVTVTLTVKQVVYDKAVADSYSTNENETLHVAAAGVLANDSDTDSPPLPLSAVLVAGPSHGTLTLNANGSFEYVPMPNFFGSDSFTYKDNDKNTDSNTVTVTLTVTQVVYDHAVADSYSTNENETLHVAAAGVLANDSDTDSPPLPLSAVLVAGPSHGVLTLNANGSFEYVPTHNFSGSDSFTYKDNDKNTDSNTVTVTLTVTQVVYDKAVADSYSTHENVALEVAAPGVLANDTETDNPPLTLEVLEAVTTPAHGTLTLKPDGSFKYTPTAGYHGPDSFSYKDTDGNTTTNTATVSLTVGQVDQAPVVSVPLAQTVNSGETLTFNSAGAGVISVSDADSEGGVERVTLTAAHGTLAPGSSAGLTVSGSGTGALTLEGTIAALDTGLEGAKYTANVHYGGSDTLAVEANDLGHTGLEGPKTATGTVPLTIVHTNEAPVLTVPGEQKVNENTSSVATSLAFSKANLNAIAVKDEDAQGGVERVSLGVTHGTLLPGSASGLTVTGSGTASLTLEGTLTAIGEGLEGLLYTPTLNYSGPDALSLEANDLGHSGAGGSKTSTAGVVLTVVHPNPIPVNPTYSGAIGNTEFSVGVSGGGSPDVEQSGSVLPAPAEGPDGSTLSVTKETIVTEHGGSVAMNENGTFTYQPPAGFENGNDKFSYTENDSRGGKATGTVTIKVDNVRVWYVNDNLGSNGNGGSNAPFNVLSSIAGASTGSGDVIFLYGGGGSYTGGIELKSNQILDGQDEGLTVEGHLLVAASGSNPTITNGAGTGVKLAEGDTVEGVTVSSTSGAGIAATNANAFTLNSKVLISGTTGNGLEVSGGNGAVTDEATISTSSAHSLLVEKRSGGTFAASGAITDTGAGVALSANTGATINLTGKLSLTTTTHGAFSATGGGTVTATSGENTATTTTGVAVNVQNTTIGAGELKFKSISSNGASDGIVLANTGSSGGLHVAGTGVSGSGGAIASSTGPGISLSSTSDVQLASVNVTNGGNDGIRGSGVSGFALTGSSSVSGNGNAVGEDGLDFTNLTGTVTFTNATVSGNADRDVSVVNESGAVSATFTEGSYSNTNNSAVGEDGIFFEGTNTGSIGVDVQKATFTNNRDDHIQVTTDASNTVSEKVTINESTLSNTVGQPGGGITLNPGGNSTMEAEVTNNNIQGARIEGITVDTPGSISSPQPATVDVTISGNTIGNPAVAESGSSSGDDIGVKSNGSATVKALVTDNSLYQYANAFGLELVQNEGVGTLDATVRGNTISHPVSTALSGLRMVIGSEEGDTGTSCLDVGGAAALANILTGSATTGNPDIRFAMNGEATAQLAGYGGGAHETAAVETYLAGRNTTSASPPVRATQFDSTSHYAAVASCPLP